MKILPLISVSAISIGAIVWIYVLLRGRVFQTLLAHLKHDGALLPSWSHIFCALTLLTLITSLARSAIRQWMLISGIDGSLAAACTCSRLPHCCFVSLCALLSLSFICLQTIEMSSICTFKLLTLARAVAQYNKQIRCASFAFVVVLLDFKRSTRIGNSNLALCHIIAQHLFELENWNFREKTRFNKLRMRTPFSNCTQNQVVINL